MGLLSDPVVLVDEAAASRSFERRGQQPDKKSVVGDYVESAADLAADSKIVIKHDNTGSVPRHLAQRTIKLVPTSATDGVRKKITINTTVVADPAFSKSEVKNEFTLHQDMLAEADFCDGLLTGLI